MIQVKHLNKTYISKNGIETKAIAIVGAYVGVLVINRILYSRFYLSFSILSFGVITALLVAMLSFLSVTLVALIPIIKVSHRTPVESMKVK